MCALRSPFDVELPFTIFGKLSLALEKTPRSPPDRSHSVAVIYSLEYQDLGWQDGIDDGTHFSLVQPHVADHDELVLSEVSAKTTYPEALKINRKLPGRLSVKSDLPATPGAHSRVLVAGSISTLGPDEALRIRRVAKTEEDRWTYHAFDVCSLLSPIHGQDNLGFCGHP
ncbi:uncharacterized protein F5891DRAFT_1175509 [Suillus fuscotomentosus]|uniref:Uncharacterized protein n=1 Tax=Suillus fuscotomentosus TaxID=1912939 RepID=A0AAD4DWU7_9AGAM|nr:uncharacterized protein F5891DRAFT_1175509 [Suillus fuscotomentosus]KAG1895628.1 hypothetical protein F5891DRAFT_1175509 [Suillus fuscotomentosus]